MSVEDEEDSKNNYSFKQVDTDPGIKVYGGLDLK